MSQPDNLLTEWLMKIEAGLDSFNVPALLPTDALTHEPNLIFQLIDHIESLDEEAIANDDTHYSACLIAFEICLAEINGAGQSFQHIKKEQLSAIMSYLADIFSHTQHTLDFWLPLINTFYDEKIEISNQLKSAYVSLAMDVESNHQSDIESVNALRNLIYELSDLSVYELAHQVFTQSFVLPYDILYNLMLDLLSMPEGQGICILMLLHPDFDVRELFISIFEQVIESIELKSINLTRLDMIKHWYPEVYHHQFKHWLKSQRRQGVTYTPLTKAEIIFIKACEWDPSGLQNIFIQFKKDRVKRFCGITLDAEGIKDVWFSQDLTHKELREYMQLSTEEQVTLRRVDTAYLELMINHHLAVGLKHYKIGPLLLLELQESLGLTFIPSLIDNQSLFNTLALSLQPITSAAQDEALEQSKKWTREKKYTESWYVENTAIDKWVNHHCKIISGTKVCNFEDTVTDIFLHVFEKQRDRWLQHFLFMTLWLRASSTKHEKHFKEVFFIACAIEQGTPLIEIPIMYDIAYQSALNSLETMQVRRTHLQ